MDFCNEKVNGAVFPAIDCDKVSRPGFYKEEGFGHPRLHKEYFRAGVAHVCCHHMMQGPCKGDYLQCTSDDYTYDG